MSGITCTIKLKEHLQHFYSGRVGITYLIEKRDTFFNCAVFPYLRQRTRFGGKINNHVPVIELKPEEVYHFELHNYSVIDIKTGNWFVPQVFFNQLEDILEHHFDSVYYSHLTRYKYMQNAVYDFASNYGMELNDRSFNMLKKRFYRAREDDEKNVKKHKKNTHDLSLIVPEISLL